VVHSQIQNLLSRKTPWEALKLEKVPWGVHDRRAAELKVGPYLATAVLMLLVAIPASAQKPLPVFDMHLHTSLAPAPSVTVTPKLSPPRPVRWSYLMRSS
jgi:hypothetical protein